MRHVRNHSASGEMRPHRATRRYRLGVTDQPDDEPSTALDHVANAAPEVAAGAAGGLIGFAIGGPLGAVIGGAITPAMVTTWRVGNAALAGRIQRGSRALEVAADQTGKSLDALAEAALADAGRLELLARVLEAAGRTPLPEKVPALGHVLAEGLEPDAVLAEALILAAALDVIEAPHVQVLKQLRDGAEGQQLGVLSANLTVLQPLLVPILHTLQAQGLAEDVSVPDVGPSMAEFVSPSTRRGEPLWRRTALGTRCLALLADPG